MTKVRSARACASCSLETAHRDGRGDAEEGGGVGGRQEPRAARERGVPAAAATAATAPAASPSSAAPRARRRPLPRSRRAPRPRGSRSAAIGSPRRRCGDDASPLLVPGPEEPDPQREVDRVVDDEGRDDRRPAEEQRPERRERAEERAERGPEEPVAERRERTLQRLLVLERLGTRLRPGRDLLLVVDRAAEDRRRHVRVAVEEAEVTGERLLAPRRRRGRARRGPARWHRRSRGSACRGGSRPPAGTGSARRRGPGSGSGGHGAPPAEPPGATSTRPPTGAPKMAPARRARSAFAPAAQASPRRPSSRRGAGAAGRARREAAGPTAGRPPRRRRRQHRGDGEGEGEAVQVRADRRARVVVGELRLGAEREPLVPGLDEPVGLAADEGEGRAEQHGEDRDLRGGGDPERRGPARTAPPAIAAVPRASWTGSAAPRFTAPSQNSSSGAATRSPPSRSPSAQPATGASAIGRDSMACRKPLRSTAARPATRARTR